MNILFISLGCDKNLVDTEVMLGELTAAGHRIVDSEEDADVIIVNSCCFISDAKEESIQTILEMGQYKETGRLKKLIVTGCLAQRYQDELIKEMPEVDAVLGTNSIQYIKDAINELETEKEHTVYKRMEELNYIPKYEHSRVLSTPGHYAHLKIAEGCNKMCSYCIIPYIRGTYRSVPMEEIIKQAKELAQKGVKELILIAQETTLYGIDLYGKKSLHLLLDELNKIPGIVWIRIMYCYPEEIYDELVDSMIRNEKVCHYLDMPIQHCSDRILKSMNRRTNKKELVENIKKLRERIPDICLRTTLITGFPGETQEDHEELMEFIDELEFDRLGAFTYSPEEGTPASTFENQIPEEQKEDWKAEIMELSEEVLADKNQEYIGKTLLVLIDGKVADENTYIGRSFRDAPDIDGYVFVSSDVELMTGDYVRVTITGAYEYDLIGEIENEFTK